jgi:hypothetical protein
MGDVPTMLAKTDPAPVGVVAAVNTPMLLNVAEDEGLIRFGGVTKPLLLVLGVSATAGVVAAVEEDPATPELLEVDSTLCKCFILPRPLPLRLPNTGPEIEPW